MLFRSGTSEPRRDTWVWDGATWTQAHEYVVARLGSFDAAYDGARDQTLLFGDTLAGPMETWVLRDGWIRTFDGDGETFEPFVERRFDLPETPEAFLREVRKPVQMTYAELSQHIEAGQARVEALLHLAPELPFDAGETADEAEPQTQIVILLGDIADHGLEQIGLGHQIALQSIAITDFSSVYISIATRPLSRPMPDCL